MEIRKKLLSIALGGALILSSIAGCSNENTNEKVASTQPPQQTEIINIQGVSEDPTTWIYLDPTTNIMYREAVFDSGRKYSGGTATDRRQSCFPAVHYGRHLHLPGHRLCRLVSADRP